jgi:hypothetical protein
MARWFAVAVVGLNAIGQMLFIPAYPLLAIFAADIVRAVGLRAPASRPNHPAPGEVPGPVYSR